MSIGHCNGGGHEQVGDTPEALDPKPLQLPTPSAAYWCTGSLASVAAPPPSGVSLGRYPPTNAAAVPGL